MKADVSRSHTVYKNRSKNQTIKTTNSGIKLSAALLCTIISTKLVFGRGFCYTTIQQQKVRTSENSKIS